MLMLERNDHDIEDGMNYNTFFWSKVHEISNQSIHISWSLQPSIKINEVMKGKAITSI